MDEIFHKSRMHLTLKFQLTEVNPYPKCFKETGIAVKVAKMSPFLKERQYLVRHIIPNSEKRLSRLPLPCRPPRSFCV